MILDGENEVVPDVVWISRSRFEGALDEQGHLRVAPELIVEVLSPGEANERRDRDLKLRLYSRVAVHDYWIVDWQSQRVDIFRREQDCLSLLETLASEDTIETPLLPGFSCPVSRLWVSF